jgi:predicted methyltransferase
MTTKTLRAAAIVMSLCAACGAGPRENEPAVSGPRSAHQHSHGAEHGFADPAAYAHTLDDPQRDSWQKPEEVVSLLDASLEATVADLGAGTGYFLPYLSRAVGPTGQVLALDTDRGMIELVDARIERDGLDNVETRLVGPGDPGLGAGSVDRILVVNTWHHLTARTDYARKLLTALRPGGRLLIVDFQTSSPVGPPAAMRLTPDTVLRELRAAGLAAERLAESLPYQYAILGRVPSQPIAR